MITNPNTELLQKDASLLLHNILICITRNVINFFLFEVKFYYLNSNLYHLAQFSSIHVPL